MKTLVRLIKVVCFRFQVDPQANGSLLNAALTVFTLERRRQSLTSPERQVTRKYFLIPSGRRPESKRSARLEAHLYIRIHLTPQAQ